jgi:G3E family GTPase
MHLLLFSGFLGSGKTTLILPLSKAVVQFGYRVAIIVNEIGEIGIDNQVMRHLDLNVWELVAGCICCTLSGDLIATLQKLDLDHAPDLVIVEASGAADPKSVLGALPYYRGRSLSSVRTGSVLDPLRLPMLIEVMTPLITSQIQHADLIIVTKSDLATSDQIDFACRTARKINPKARIVSAAVRGHLEPELISELMPWLN